MTANAQRNTWLTKLTERARALINASKILPLQPTLSASKVTADFQEPQKRRAKREDFNGKLHPKRKANARRYTKASTKHILLTCNAQPTKPENAINSSLKFPHSPSSRLKTRLASNSVHTQALATKQEANVAEPSSCCSEAGRLKKVLSGRLPRCLG